MPITTKTVTRVALREAEVVFAQEMADELRELGKVLQTAVREKMKVDLGAERKNVKRKVTGSQYRKTLTVSGDLVQTLVDEFGRRKGIPVERFRKTERGFRTVKFYTLMPPSGPGSTLRAWAERKGITGYYALALKIARDGIPAQRPFARTAEESQTLIATALNNVVERGVKRLNA